MNKFLIRKCSDISSATTLRVLVMCYELFSKPLCEALQYCQKNESNIYDLHIITCKNINEILYHTDNLIIDYAVIVLDTTYRDCISAVEYNIQLMDSSILSGRTCIVNGNPHIPLTDVNVSLESIIALKQKYGLPVLNGNILHAESCLHLCQRILTLIKASLGIDKNFPFLPWFQS